MFYCICGCVSQPDGLIDCTQRREIVSQLKTLNESSRYDDIVRILGKPSEQFNPPTNPAEQYILYYRCRENTGQGFWVMLHYPEKTYWYSSDNILELGEPFCSNRLVHALYSKGANPAATEKIIVRGNEGGFGSDISVAITDPNVINRVWTAIINSQNYGVFSACGFRRIEFHSAEHPDTPLATLKLLCGPGDPVYLKEQEPLAWVASKGGRDGLYQCLGLNGLIEPYLREEYNRRQKEQKKPHSSEIAGSVQRPRSVSKRRIQDMSYH